MKKLANEAQTPVTEKTDLKAQLAEVAERIRTMREIIGLSEEEMAQRTGVTLEEYRGFESGEHDFSFTFIFKCAERFGIDPTDHKPASFHIYRHPPRRGPAHYAPSGL